MTQADSVNDCKNDCKYNPEKHNNTYVCNPCMVSRHIFPHLVKHLKMDRVAARHFGKFNGQEKIKD